MKSTPKTLFVYGTLCRAEVRRKALGRVGQTEKAVLHGYARKNGKWPYLVKKPGGLVKGLILKNLTARDWKKLDTYEDVAEGLYIRTSLCLNGKTHFVYLPDLSKWPPEWR